MNDVEVNSYGVMLGYRMFGLNRNIGNWTRISTPVSKYCSYTLDMTVSRTPCKFCCNKTTCRTTPSVVTNDRVVDVTSNDQSINQSINQSSLKQIGCLRHN